MSKPIVVPDLIDTLPFHEALSWEKFQSLCTDILYKNFKSLDSREYLLKGSDQQGIDVYSVKRGEEKITVAQCKLVEYLGPQQVLDILGDFLKGNLVSDTKEFILCTSADLGRQRDEERTITESRKKLAGQGIDLIIWDERGLSKELRTNSTPEIINIIYRYFGEDVALKFYGDIWVQYINTLKVVKKRSYPIPQDYIERNIISYSDQLDNKKKTSWSYWYNESKDTLLSYLEDRVGKEGKKVVLLSTAGFGKTEELKNVAGYFSAEKKIPYPVKFSLRDYEGQSLEIILSNYDSNWKNIGEENILLLFDGLDEISEHNFQTFINYLNAFVEQRPNIQVVISSRYNFYDVSHPPLRGFEIFLLYPLNYYDTEKYIIKKLGNQKEEFINILQQHGFFEYIQNPYYLTRLVRFFNNKEVAFPKNKTELFDKILFEQLEKDEGTYNIKELKDRLMPFARQIAFCMTIAGKSTLVDAEIKMLIANQETRALLNRFSILNRNATTAGSWSFEHKNLQEYLSASVFSSQPFNEIHSIISFKLDNNKLLPRFLNTVSFLFELISKDSSLFQDLFSWINKNEPELLIRFEKEQLSKQTRNDIFFRIFNYYKGKGITLRVSANFSFQELAWFVEIDNDIIDFLAQELEADIPPELAYDALNILSHCKRAFIFREKIENILFAILNDKKYPDFILAKAIFTFNSLEFSEQIVFQKILTSGIDLANVEIRRACISFLDFTSYAENFSQFIFDSIAILEEGQKQNNVSGYLMTLKRILLKFTSPKKIKEIFQYSMKDKDCFKRHSHLREFHFDFNEIKDLLAKAIDVYKVDTSILPLVYRLFCSLEHITIEREWFAPFRSFFEMTCGTNIIFHKFYKYGKKQRDIMAFADQDSCNYLINEYKIGNIEDRQMIYYRNTLSHSNRELFLSFYNDLKDLGDGQFVIDDITTDYNDLRIKQEVKNQLMLLDRSSFMEEALVLFGIIAKENVTTEDLWYSENGDLRKYQNSIVLETIRNMCIHNQDKMITKKEFLNRYNSDSEWEGFVIDSILGLLQNKNIPSVNQDLLLIASEWCKNKIETLDFENSITDIGDSFRYIHIVEFVKDLFLLLDLDLEDKLLLKMLPSDFESYYGWTDDTTRTISSVVTKKVKDKNLLQSTVISNIKNSNLAILVLCSHFAVCHKLGYRECLPFLFQTIVANPLVSDHNRVKLTEYYFDLGGENADFIAYLKIPDVETEAAKYASWQWFIIENLLPVASDKIADILIQILADSAQTINKLSAAENLLKLSRIEGLIYVETYIMETGIIPFEHKWSNLQQYIIALPGEKAIDIFCSILGYSYESGLHNKFRGEHSIEECCFGSLNTLSSREHNLYLVVKNRLTKMIIDFAERPFIFSLIYYSERFTQRYYESQTQEMDITTANLIYESISNI